MLNELPSAARSVKFKILESMPADKAKSFSTDHLSAIAAAANGDVTQAKVLTDAWLNSDTVSKAVLDFALPVVDADFTAETLGAKQSEIIKGLGKGYTQTTFADYIAEMQRLTTGTPAERLKAQEMYLSLGTIASVANRELGPEAVTKLKQNVQIGRAKKDAASATAPVKTSIKNILQAISGRGAKNWLHTQGTQKLAPLVSELATLETDLQLKLAANLEPEVLQTELNNFQNKVKEIKGRAAGELAAFLGDGNTRPGDALDAAEQIMAAGLIDSLSPQDKKMIVDRIAKDTHLANRDQSSVQKLYSIYNAFGGTKDISNTVQQKVMNIQTPQFRY